MATGVLPDGKHLVKRARQEAANWIGFYKETIPTTTLADRLGAYVQAYTLYSSVRPFGSSAIIGGVDNNTDKSYLYLIEPSGQYWAYKGVSSGKGRQVAKNEMEKLEFDKLTVREAIKAAAKIIHTVHDDSKDKDFELEMSWISPTETNGKHEFVPQELIDEAELLAKQEDEDDEMEE